MKKFYTFLLLSFSFVSFSQGTINFDDAAKWIQGGGGIIPFTTYSDHSYVDAPLNFTAVGTSIVRNATADLDGFPGANGTYSFRLRDNASTSLTMTITSGGVGNFSFVARRWDAAPATNFTVEYSTDNGTNWTTSSTIDASVTTDSNWKTVSGVINSTNANIQIRVRSNGTTERLMIDDFSWTAPTSNPTLVISSPANGTLYNPATTSVNINFATSNFTIATIGNGDGHLNYTINGGAVQSKFDNTAIALTSLTPGTYNLALELVDDSNASLSPVVTATVSFTIQPYNIVNNINDVRLDVLNNGIGRYYEISGEAIVTFSRSATYRNQKYIQDATAAILIDDPAGIITNPFVIGDGITGLRGQTTYFNGVLQIVPLENNSPSSNGNVITPQVVTISAINASIEQYESELVRINNVTFVDGNGSNTFVINTNYSISDGNAMNFRTLFAEVDYVTNPDIIPSTPYAIIVLVAKNVTTPQVVARSFEDVTLSSSSFNAIEGLTMYPNPAKNNLFIETALNSEINVSIIDMLGKVVLNTKAVNNSINIADLQTGVYVVKITEEGKTATRKLVIE